MKRSQLATLCALALTLCSPLAHAEDIDLFIGTQASSNGLPNVLFIVDNTANWNQAFSNEMASLANTFNNLPLNDDGSAKFNVGIMLSTETGSPNSNVSGGYVRAAIRPMTATKRAAYATLISSLDKLADKGNGGVSSLNMTEAYYYFSGLAPYSGNNKIKADFTGNTFGSTASNAIYALGSNALSSLSATQYHAPGGSSCSKNYIIYISNGPNQENNSVSTQASSRLSAAGGSTTQIPLSPTGSQSNPADEWARFMKQSALGVTTYTIDVDAPTNGQGPGWTALLKSMAGISGGKYAAVSSAVGAGSQISDAVNRALSEIQAVNSVFASVSLPLSVNTQGTFLNQVYVGLFRPDADALPQWNGNLKQYKLGRVGLDLRLKDADDRGAINSLTGFITECARSYWTPTSADNYWTFRPQGACIPPTGSGVDLYRNSNFPDGNIVEKGAQAFTRRSSTTRALKTCSPTFGSCTSLTDFSLANTSISESLLGAGSPTERTQLIQWALGLDLNDENLNGVTTGEMRPSVHGDVVHSRPAAINFGTSAAPNVVVFYGANDGVFRAINGNRTSNIGSVAPGAELWGFVPPEFYGNIKRLRDNTTRITLANSTGTTLPKPYGIDGSVTAYTDSSRAWLYAGMRRGGRALYAFNVDVNDPSNISLKWKRGCPENFPLSGTVSDTGCTTGFSGMGQTWSSPKTLFAAGYGSAPLLLMGGGYDSCEDAEPHTCTTTSKGNKVYVLDANTGALLNTFSTERGVIADVAVVPDLTTGQALFAYVVDLGGNVYRVDIGSDAPAAWSMTKIAALGCDTTSPCALNRKFMFAPDIALESGTYMLLLGSGDREKPRNYSNPVDNYFFTIRDRPGDATWLSSEAGRCGSAILCLASLTPILSAANPSQSDLDAGKGWYLGLNSNEQVVTAALTIFGTVTFSTNQPVLPASGVCSSNLGTARVYNISYRNAAPESGAADRSQALPASIGLPPSPVGGLVTLDDGQTVPFCIGCSPDSPLEGEEPAVPPSSAPSQPKGRVYWYIQR
jgi:type IV pilus assembly protein PilY1